MKCDMWGSIYFHEYRTILRSAYERSHNTLYVTRKIPAFIRRVHYSSLIGRRKNSCVSTITTPSFGFIDKLNHIKGTRSLCSFESSTTEDPFKIYEQKVENINKSLKTLGEREVNLAKRVFDLIGGDFAGNQRQQALQKKKNLVLDEKPVLKRHELDCGSSEVQIALLTARINNLDAHFISARKDNQSKRSYTALVYQRQALLKYLKRTRFDRFKKLQEELNIPVMDSLDSVKKVKKNQSRRMKANVVRQKMLQEMQELSKNQKLDLK